MDTFLLVVVSKLVMTNSKNKLFIALNGSKSENSIFSHMDLIT